MRNILQIILYFVISLGLGGCAHKLVEDQAGVAIDNNYPSLEMFIQNQSWRGLGIIGVPEGTTPSVFNTPVVQGYHRGTLRIESRRCGISETIAYTENEAIRTPLPDPIVESCLITYTLSPDYDENTAGPIKTYSFRGHFYIKVYDEDDLDKWQGYIARGKNGLGFKQMIATDARRARVVIRGCDVQYDKVHENISGFLELPLDEIIPAWDTLQTCTLQGVVFGGVDEIFTVLVNTQDFRYPTLAAPIVSMSGNKVTIEAESNVSIVSVGEKYEIDNKGSFTVNPAGYYRARILTVKGRSLLGTYSPESGWRWK